MRIASLNLNGLRSATKKGLNGWIAAAELDVICLQEMRMQQNQLDQHHGPPQSWDSIQADAQKKGYSGVAIWSARPALEKSIGLGLDWADDEGRVCKFSLENLDVYSIYFPSGTSGPERQSKKDAFLERILIEGQKWLTQREHVLICADVNIAHTENDIHNPKGNKRNSGFLPHERDWFSRFLQSGWHDVYRELHPDVQDYTWWSQRRKTVRIENKGWRIDYHLASPALAAKAVSGYVFDRNVKLSDHAPVVIDYAL